MKRFNIDEFLWFIVLISLNIWLIYLIKSSKASFYIGNKITKYLYIAVFFITVISLFQFINIFTPKNINNIRVKTIPVIFAIIIGVVSLNFSNTFKHIELNKELSHTVHEHSHEDHKKIDLDEKLEEEKSLKENNIIIDETNAFLLKIINEKPENYISKNLEVHGFICKENYLNENQFIVGRLIMNCCAADAEAVGIICEGKIKNNFRENENVCIKGNVKFSYVKGVDNKDFKVPVLSVSSIEKEDLKRKLR